MKTTLPILVLLFGITGQPLLSAQVPLAPQVQWERIVGGTSYDAMYRFVETPDGGLVCGGVSLSGVSGNKTSPNWDTNAVWGGDYWVVKVDRNGRTVWDRSYGGNDWDGLDSMELTPDGGIILGGECWQSRGGNKDSQAFGYFDWWLVRLDASGAKLWDASAGGSRNDIFWSLTQSADGGILAVGTSDSRPGDGGNKTSPFFGGEEFKADAWAVKLDAFGNKLWDKSFGGCCSEQIRSIDRAADGGAILTGWSASHTGGNKTSPGFGYADMWVFKLDDDGNTAWDQSFGGSSNDGVQQIITTSDGGAILAGTTTSPADGNKTSTPLGPYDQWGFLAADIWLVRVNGLGQKLWERAIGTADYDSLLEIRPMADNGIALSGYTTFVSDFDLSTTDEYFVVRLNSNGDELWRVNFDENTAIRRLLEMPDGGVLLAADSSGTNSWKTSPGYGSEDCWLVRLDSRGNRIWDLTLGGSGSDLCDTLYRTRDGGFVVAIHSDTVLDAVPGNKPHPGYGDKDAWIIKFGSDRPPDNDGDGVPDQLDQCPNTPPGEIANTSGCSIEQLTPCDGPWKNHGHYISVVARLSTQFRKAGFITQKQRLAIFLRAVKSDCGKPSSGRQSRSLVPRDIKSERKLTAVR